MGNCQAIDAASLVIQHQNGKVDKMYWPISASEVMKLNPGHYVALLITTTTICHTTSSSSSSDAKTADTTTAAAKSNSSSSNSQKSVRITRVKLLRPIDTLALGHVYRLISTQEVMKGLVAKKQAKMRKNGIELADSEGLKEAEKLVKNFQQDKHHHHQVSRHGQRSRTKSGGNGGGTTRPKTWRPSLNSISEFTS